MSQEHEMQESGSNTAVAEKPVREKSVQKTKPQQLPPWKVLLHNDDINTYMFVVQSILRLTPLKQPQAIACMKEAHLKGVSLLLVTHKERAELYQEQFTSLGLTVTIEPDEKR